jgi:hypothetical protein
MPETSRSPRPDDCSPRRVRRSTPSLLGWVRTGADRRVDRHGAERDPFADRIAGLGDVGVTVDAGVGNRLRVGIGEFAHVLGIAVEFKILRRWRWS